jgi:uncharacterized protein YndB with AHSA1/START domain
VFGAWSDPKAKAQWFGGPAEWTSKARELDFRVGGREIDRGGPKGGPVFSFQSRYQDIVPNQRIIYTYEMHVDDKRISVSVATIEFIAAGTGTRLVLTEQGAYLDGLDDPKQREHGTRELLEALDAALTRMAAKA